MADPKRIDLKVVNEDYVAPAGATPHQQLEARLAAAIKEGKRRANAELGKRIDDAAAQQIKGVKSAHVDELNRAGVLIARASHRDGLWHGMVLGGAVIAVVIALALYAGAWLQGSGWGMRVADERIPRAAVPVLQDNYTPPSYARDNPREPGDAPALN